MILLCVYCMHVLKCVMPPLAEWLPKGGSLWLRTRRWATPRCRSQNTVRWEDIQGCGRRGRRRGTVREEKGFWQPEALSPTSPSYLAPPPKPWNKPIHDDRLRLPLSYLPNWKCYSCLYGEWQLEKKIKNCRRIRLGGGGVCCWMQTVDNHFVVQDQ